MPYKTTEQLPESVKSSLPKGAQDIFLNVVNSQIDRELSEDAAFASAWAAVKRSYEKDESGEWVEIDKQSDGTYVSMRVKNSEEFSEWFKSQGIDVVPTEELHTTIAFSRKPFTIVPSANEITVTPSQLKSIEPLGDDGAIVLKMECEELQNRFNDCMEAGATYDYDDYIPHITITYNVEGLDLSNISKPNFPIVLHKETVEALNLNWKEDLEKADEEEAICKELVAMHEIEKAEYQGREVELNKPFRTPNESKKFAVYVQDGDVVKIVRFDIVDYIKSIDLDYEVEYENS